MPARGGAAPVVPAGGDRRLVRDVPSETDGFSTADAGSGDALFPYGELPFAGTVTLSADAAGPGYEIVIVLEERLAG